MCDDQQAANAAENEDTIAEQTVVYPVTKLTRRKPPKVMIEPVDKGQRVAYSPSQLYTLYTAKELLLKSDKHADDGSDDLAAVAASQLLTFLRRYPVEWVEKKKGEPKKKT